MTASSNILSRRAALGGIALAGVAGLAHVAIGSLPQPESAGESRFNALVAEYRRLRALRDHDSRHGEMGKAEAAFHAKTISYDELTAAEARHAAAFGDPAWEAALAVFAFPAPSARALVIKIDLADGEDALDEDRASQPIIADARRLAAQEA